MAVVPPWYFYGMRYWLPLGRIRGIGASLYVHISVVIAVAILASAAFTDPLYAAVAILSLIGLIFLHELGHALVAHHFGYAVTAIRLGLIHGACEYDAEDYEWERALIAWGGVAAQLLVAVPVCLLDALWHGPLGILAPAVLIFGYWSLVIVVINLIPLAGLDGESAWRAVPLMRGRFAARRATQTALKRIRSRGR